MPDPTCSELLQRIETLTAELDAFRTHADAPRPSGDVGAAGELVFFKRAVESATDAIGLSTPEGRHYYQNEAMTALFGRTTPEVDGTSGPPSSVYVDEAVGREVFETIVGGGTWIGEVKMFGSGGRVLDVLIRAYPVRDDAGKVIGVVGLHHDITEKKRAEERLQHVLKALDCASDAIGISDPRGRHIYQNRALSELLEYESAEHLDAAGGGPAVVKDPAVAKAMFEAIMSGRSWTGELEMVTRSGRVFPAYERADAILDEHGAIIGLIGIITDLTRQKAAEASLRESRERLEQERARSSRLESVGMLAGGLAHDFNNILTALLGNLSLARQFGADGSQEMRELLAESERACRKAATLTTQLLTFSKGGEPVKRVMPIAPVVRESAGLALAGSSVKADFAVQEGIGLVEIDSDQVGQLVANVVANAVQSMPGGGTMVFELTETQVGPGGLQPLAPGRYVRLSVRDQGSGIPAEHLDKVFDPFFTTRPGATGLGLAACYSIARRHGGHITIASQPGEGTTVVVFLPVTSTPQAHAASGGDAALRKCRVLVMDDEPTVLKVASMMLGRAGHGARTAADGAEAIELYREAFESREPFDLVILDLTVPGGLGGTDTLARLRAIDPGVRAIVSSGYSSDAVIANYARWGFVGVLAKPYVMADLLEAVRTATTG